MAEIDRVIEELEQHICYKQNICLDGFCKENECSVQNAIQTIRELQNQIPKWHLCSEELPKEATCYLCAVKHRFNKDDRWRWTVTDIVLFGTENNWIVDENKNEVIAWMEPPKFEGVE